MIKTSKEIHISFCNYMIEKASKEKIFSVKAEEKKNLGIITSELTRNELINALAN